MIRDRPGTPRVALPGEDGQLSVVPMATHGGFPSSPPLELAARERLRATLAPSVGRLVVVHERGWCKAAVVVVVVVVTNVVCDARGRRLITDWRDGSAAREERCAARDAG